MPQCPICGQEVPAYRLDRHVNICIDRQARNEALLERQARAARLDVATSSLLDDLRADKQQQLALLRQRSAHWMPNDDTGNSGLLSVCVETVRISSIQGRDVPFDVQVACAGDTARSIVYDGTAYTCVPVLDYHGSLPVNVSIHSAAAPRSRWKRGLGAPDDVMAGPAQVSGAGTATPPIGRSNAQHKLGVCLGTVSLTLQDCLSLHSRRGEDLEAAASEGAGGRRSVSGVGGGPRLGTSASLGNIHAGRLSGGLDRPFCSQGPWAASPSGSDRWDRSRLDGLSSFRSSLDRAGPAESGQGGERSGHSPRPMSQRAVTPRAVSPRVGYSSSRSQGLRPVAPMRHGHFVQADGPLLVRAGPPPVQTQPDEGQDMAGQQSGHSGVEISRPSGGWLGMRRHELRIPVSWETLAAAGITLAPATATAATQPECPPPGCAGVCTPMRRRSLLLSAWYRLTSCFALPAEDIVRGMPVGMGMAMQSQNLQGKQLAAVPGVHNVSAAGAGLDDPTAPSSPGLHINGTNGNTHNASTSQASTTTPMLTVRLRAIYIPLNDVTGPRAGSDVPGCAPSWTALHRAVADDEEPLVRALLRACGPQAALYRTALTVPKPPADIAGLSPGMLQLGSLSCWDVAGLCGSARSAATLSQACVPGPRLTGPPAGLHALHAAVLGGNAEVLRHCLAAILGAAKGDNAKMSGKNRHGGQRSGAATRASSPLEDAGPQNTAAAGPGAARATAVDGPGLQASDLASILSLDPALAANLAVGDPILAANMTVSELQARQVESMVNEWMEELEEALAAPASGSAAAGPAAAGPATAAPMAASVRRGKQALTLPWLSWSIPGTEAGGMAPAQGIIQQGAAAAPGLPNSSNSSLSVFERARQLGLLARVPPRGDSSATSGQTHAARAAHSVMAMVSQLLGGPQVIMPVQHGLIDVRDIGGRTPLAMAAVLGRPAMVSQLLEAGAAPGLPDYSGITPLMHALSDGGRPCEVMMSHATVALQLLLRLHPDDIGRTWTAVGKDIGQGVRTGPASTTTEPVRAVCGCVLQAHVPVSHALGLGTGTPTGAPSGGTGRPGEEPADLRLTLTYSSSQTGAPIRLSLTPAALRNKIARCRPRATAMTMALGPGADHDVGTAAGHQQSPYGLPVSTLGIVVQALSTGPASRCGTQEHALLLDVLLCLVETGCDAHSAGVRFSCVDSNGLRSTPLHLAAGSGNMCALRILTRTDTLGVYEALCKLPVSKLQAPEITSTMVLFPRPAGVAADGVGSHKDAAASDDGDAAVVDPSTVAVESGLIDSEMHALAVSTGLLPSLSTAQGLPVGADGTAPHGGTAQAHTSTSSTGAAQGSMGDDGRGSRCNRYAEPWARRAALTARDEAGLTPLQAAVATLQTVQSHTAGQGQAAGVRGDEAQQDGTASHDSLLACIHLLQRLETLNSWVASRFEDGDGLNSWSRANDDDSDSSDN